MSSESLNRQKLNLAGINKTTGVVTNSQREALGTLSSVYQKSTDENGFLELLKNGNHVEMLLIKYLFGKNSIDELDEKELAYFKKVKGKYEIFQIFDEDDNPLFYENGLPVVEFRKNCHGKSEYNKGIENYHRAICFIVTNLKGEILLSLRSEDKDTFPSHWEVGGGHIDLMESYEQTLIRELGEELNLKEGEYEIVPLGKLSLEDNDSKNGQKQHMKIFNIKLGDGVEIKPDEGEISESKYFNPDTIIKLLNQNNIKMVPHHKYFLLNYLRKIGYDINPIMEIFERELENLGTRIGNQNWNI